MATPPHIPATSLPRPGSESPSGGEHLHFLYFSELLRRPVCAGSIRDRIGKVTDLVFRHAEPFPEVVGIHLEHGWGNPAEFVPWDRVIKVEDDAVFVQPAPGGDRYPAFVDQP